MVQKIKNIINIGISHGKNDYERRVIRLLNELFLVAFLGQLVLGVFDFAIDNSTFSPYDFLMRESLAILGWAVNYYGKFRITQFLVTWLLPALGLMIQFIVPFPPHYHYFLLIAFTIGIILIEERRLRTGFFFYITIVFCIFYLLNMI